MRSMLFVPADSERKIAKALTSGADAVILDLEDSVAPANKPAARELAARVLRDRRSASPRLFVRTNALDSGLADQDLEAVLPANPDGLMQPKTESGQDVARLSAMTGRIIPTIAIATETAKSIFHLDSYAQAGPALEGLTWGAEDLSNDIGATANRDEQGRLTEPYRLVRSLCLFGARTADVDAIDSVFVNFRDDAGLERECLEAVRDGFTAKMAIHPAQIETINRIFTPSGKDIAHAERIIAAFEAGGDAGVVALDGEMYDIPHLKRARKMLERAAKGQQRP